MQHNRLSVIVATPACMVRNSKVIKKDIVTSPANDKDRAPSPVVHMSDIIVQRNLRSAILPVNILFPIAAFLLSVVIPLHPHQSVLVIAAMQLPTVIVLLSAIAAHQEEEREISTTTTTPMPTLREFLSHPDGFHMGFAPAFFGFFAYFGALAAMEEETNGLVVPKLSTNDGRRLGGCKLQSVAGASAGAMAAVMLGAGIQPRAAAEFASKFTWGMLADPPGLGAFVKGNIFEKAMRNFIAEHCVRNHNHPLPVQLERALIPVSVSAFDLFRMRGTNLIEGCMARSARASAGFPGLFQPVAWREKGRRVDESSGNSWLPDSLLIDGGITDGLGLNGLGVTSSSDAKKKRVINLVVGHYNFLRPRDIGALTKRVNADCLVSVALVGTPTCGPWAMKNGPRAFESARMAMLAALDKPMVRGTSDNHYVIHVNASKFLDSQVTEEAMTSASGVVKEG